VVNVRVKGAKGERELKPVFLEHLGLYFTRNLTQTRGGGYDCDLRDKEEHGTIAIPIAFEVKRDNQMTLEAMWNQALQQAKDVQMIPVVAYRRDRKKWRFIVPHALLYFSNSAPNKEQIKSTYVDYSKTLEMGLDLFISGCKGLLSLPSAS